MGSEWHWGYDVHPFFFRSGILMHLLSAYTDYIDKNLTTTDNCAIYFSKYYSFNSSDHDLYGSRACTVLR